MYGVSGALYRLPPYSTVSRIDEARHGTARLEARRFDERNAEARRVETEDLLATVNAARDGQAEKEREFFDARDKRIVETTAHFSDAARRAFELRLALSVP